MSNSKHLQTDEQQRARDLRTEMWIITRFILENPTSNNASARNPSDGQIWLREYTAPTVVSTLQTYEHQKKLGFLPLVSARLITVASCPLTFEKQLYLAVDLSGLVKI